MENDSRKEFILLLVRHLTAGNLELKDVLPVFREFLGDQPESLSKSELIEALSEDHPSLQQLRQTLHKKRLTDAYLCHNRKRGGQQSAQESFPDLRDLPGHLPLGWVGGEEFVETARSLLEFSRDRFFIKAQNENLLVISSVIENRYQEVLSKFKGIVSDWSRLLPDVSDAPHPIQSELKADVGRRREAISKALDLLPVKLPLGLDEELLYQELEARYTQAEGDLPTQRKLLDLVLQGRTDRMASTILLICSKPWEQERASLVLMLRFGMASLLQWSNWARWLAGKSDLRRHRNQELRHLSEKFPYRLLSIWYRERPDPDPDVLRQLEVQAAAAASSVDAEKFVARWHDCFGPHEINSLLGLPESPPLSPAIAKDLQRKGALPPLLPSADNVPSKRVPAALPERRTEPPVPQPVVFLKEETVRPSVWREHVQPFISENWYMVAGLAMVLIGASLLAYFTWDKHWLLRYTLMPGALALLTVFLGKTAHWLERKDPALKSTGAMLRGAAIGLLPINFMAIALLSKDPEVTSKGLILPLMGVIYVVFFGWQLTRWCSDVHPSLGWPQGLSLLILNGLVALGPLASLMTSDRQEIRILLGIGFHLGFLAMGACVWFVAHRVLTRELVIERRVPWFFAGTMAITFFQVFAWVHGFMGYLPKTGHYASLVILSGSLILLLERRSLELRSEKGQYTGESFLGYAFVLIGLLMGMQEPRLRIFVFALAGVTWLYQATFRTGEAQYWIGLTLLMLSGASVGLLDSFPKSKEFNGLPWLGLSLALAFGVLRIIARRAMAQRLTLAALEFQPVVLILTAVVSVLSQWRFHSAPLETAFALIVTAAFFGWRAYRVQRLGWVHTTMALLALTLSYLGCVDLQGRSFHGNTLVFGLGVLSSFWLLFIAVRPSSLVLQARSTVLWTYGMVAVAAMVVRVIIERGTPGDVFWYRALMDYTGPFLMAFVLILTGYYSRSLIPSLMAAVLVAILFPGLKIQFREVFSIVTWGTGLGSAASALMLTLLAFWLKRWPLLKNMGEGDLFLGQTPFPARRYDHTLFTLPALATAIFLAMRVDAWTFLQHLARNTVGIKTSIALGMTGMTWILLAIHRRESLWSRLGIHLGWMMFFLAFYFGNRSLYSNPQLQFSFLFTGLTLQILLFLYQRAHSRYEWVHEFLFVPTQSVLRVASFVLSWWTVLYLLFGGALDRVDWLGVFLLLQLGWQGLASRQMRYGTTLFALSLVILLSWCIPGTDALLLRLSIEGAWIPLLTLALMIQVFQLVLEWKPDVYRRLEPLLKPFQGGSVVLVFVLSFVGLFEMLGMWNRTAIRFDTTDQLLLLTALLLAARANASGEFVLAAMVLGYLFLYSDTLRQISIPGNRILFLFTPWRSSLLALGMTSLACIGQQIAPRVPRLLAGPYRLADSRFSALAWIYLPATALILQAVLCHTINPDLRWNVVQLWAPYLGALALGLIAWSWKKGSFWALAGVSLAIANIHSVNLVAGKTLDEKGLSDIHVVCLGLFFTLLQGTVVRLLVKTESVLKHLDLGRVILAGLILLLLPSNYFVDPNIAAITSARFVVSGLLALAAALYFRQAALHPSSGEEKFREWYTGFHHFGISLALLCLVLLIPAFRLPNTALVALGIPASYFYLRAELGLRGAEEAAHETGRRYRNSATVMGFVLVALYVFRSAFQMILFPGVPIDTDHYHYNAPFVMMLSILLIRLRGLGGTWWLAFYGGLALVVGTYFSITSFPGLSPFEDPIAAAWIGVAVAHFFIVASYQRSPIRSIIQEIGALDFPDWIQLRRYWGRCLLVASQVLVFLGIVKGGDTYQVAPLLVGAATIFIHQGVVGNISLYYPIAGVLIGFALHADFFVPSYLSKDDVVWVILGLWAVGLIAVEFRKTWSNSKGLGPGVGILAGAIAGHVFYHHPSSVTGLWAVGLMTVLAALTPRLARYPGTAEQQIAAGSLLLAGPWVTYFSQVRLLERGPGASFEAWPVLATTASCLAVGSLVRAYFRLWASPLQGVSIAQPRLFHQALALCETAGDRINTVFLWLSLIVTSTVSVFHYQAAFSNREILLCSLLWTGLAVAWFVEGRDRKSMVPHVIWQLCVLGLFAVVRRHLMLTTDLWTYEYDVWTSLAVSCCLTGASQLIHRQDKELRTPLMWSLFALPVIAILWTMIHNLGTDITLVIIGLHSMMFAFLGKDERESPYNMVAIGGFIAFVSVLFWSKLELRVLHAYVVPVGLGILALLQIFGKELAPESKNRIRLVTLVAILGSTAYYALADPRYPLVFNLTLLVLCLGAMGLGSFVQVKLYLLLGFSGLLVTLVSIFYKVVIRLDTTYRMTSIGLLILLLGVGLVAGSAYYKTHYEDFEARLNRVRSRLGGWD